MAKSYSKSTMTLTAATAHRLSDLLAAEGYTGSMIGGLLEIDRQALTDVFIGDGPTLDATNGRALGTTPLRRQAPPVVDPSRIWLFSTGGGDIGCTFESL